jgi:2-dehydro-3-deoxyphosphogluconate aldolase/(4S)-4-hydroxy-2-oxoglutarate aldolase
MSGPQAGLTELLAGTPVIPVLLVDRVDEAVSLGRALVESGLTVLEVTLRTPVAVETIHALRAALPAATIGAGTVLSPQQTRDAVAAGAQFLVSPGATPSLLEAVASAGVPFLPGAATVSEMMVLAERGYRLIKFFPAEAAGGAAYLSGIASPLPHLRFCPTGGIDAGRAQAYLDLPNVACVGGSWMARRDWIAAGNWTAVREAAAAAARLRR